MRRRTYTRHKGEGSSSQSSVSPRLRHGPIQGECRTGVTEVVVVVVWQRVIALSGVSGGGGG